VTASKSSNLTNGCPAEPYNFRTQFSACLSMSGYGCSLVGSCWLLRAAAREDYVS
jgi:hypothetical protein